MKAKNFWLIIVLILGVILRFYNNLNISLWHDEAFSALMIRYSWPEMLQRLGLDVHPPMYYIFLRFWHNIFGDSLFSLRSFSIFFGAASILVAYALVKEILNSWKEKNIFFEDPAFWAAVFVAINPFGLQYVTEARMYTFGAFFALASAFFLVRALNLQKQAILQNNSKVFFKNKSSWAFLGFVFSTVVIIYTHYYLFFTAAAICVYGLIFLYKNYQFNFKKYWPIFICYFTIAFSFLPWLKIFLFQYRQVQAGYWILPMTIWSVPATFWDMLLGLGRDLANNSTKFWMVIITLFSLMFFYQVIKKTQNFHKWLLGFCVAAPFAGAILFAFMAQLKHSSSSVYLDRYFLFASLFYSIALAIWLSQIRIKKVAIGLCLIYCSVNLFTVWNYWNELKVKSRPGMNFAYKYLLTNIEPKHKIFVASNFEFFNFKYYWTTKDSSCPPDPVCAAKVYDPGTSYYFLKNIRPLMYTPNETKANQVSHYAGSALLSDSDLLPSYENAVQSQDTVWLVWTNAFSGPSLEKGPSVPKNWTKIDEKSFAEVRPYVSAFVVVSEYRVN